MLWLGVAPESPSATGYKPWRDSVKVAVEIWRVHEEDQESVQPARKKQRGSDVQACAVSSDADSNSDSELLLHRSMVPGESHLGKDPCTPALPGICCMHSSVGWG